MSSFLLHAVWLPLSGLGLWIEQTEGHKIVLPAAVPEGTFPEAVDQLLKKHSFRNRARMTLRTPKGKDVSLLVPMAMLGPEDAVVALDRLAGIDDRTPGVSAEQLATLGADTRWLARAYTGLRRFVRAGRVTLRLSYTNNEWLPMWQLAAGLGERGWLAEMIAAAPGVLTVNNRSLLDDMAGELTHWIAYMELRSLREKPRPYPWHDFAQAVLDTTPVKRGRTQLLRGLNEWRESITQMDLQLMFVVEEPPKDEETAASANDDALVPELTWPIRVHVRSGTDSPLPVHLHSLDPQSRQRLLEARRRAISLSSALDPELSLPAPYYSDEAGDFDTFVSTQRLIRFVSEDAVALRNAGFNVMLPKAWANMETTAKLETRELSDAAESSTQHRLGLDKLVEYDWKLSIGDTELSEAEMAQLVESKSGLIRLRGEWVMADTASLAKITEYMEQVAAASAKGAKKDGRQLGEITVAELRQLALEATAKEPIEFTGSGWHSSLLGGMETPAPERVPIPETVQAELREYQRRGVDWMHWMSRNNIGAVLADDMGLGKTLQLLSLLAVEYAERAASASAQAPTLVVAPTSVVGNWAREAARFVPHLKVVVHHGAQRDHGERLMEEIAQSNIVITTYGTVGRDFDELGKVSWDHVVLDEAQAIKNAATRSSKAVRSLPARHRIALTGTPVENRLSEMRSILDFCNPGVLGSTSFFRNHFAKAIERGDDPDLAEKLRALIAPFILRRLKTDPNIIDDLPEKSEQLITVAMTPEQAALYKALVDDVAKRLESSEGIARRGLVLASLTRIKQICNHPAHYLGDGSSVTLKGKHRSGKVAELMRIVDETVERGERLLVFTQYKAFGDLLQPYLSQQLGQEIPFLHGGVTKNRRDAMVEQFQGADGPPAMILSLKAGGTGLNLTAASVVVHMDRWWNPAVENQATDRAFRIGQQRNVTVFKMITAGTLEESIQDILDGKTQLAGAIVGEGEGWLTELSPQQLAALMSYREMD